MRDHAREATAAMQGKTRDELGSNRILALAVIHLFGIIGEAAGRIPKAEQEKYPRIRWSEITGMRHRIVHGYDALDLDVVWDVIQSDLPVLVRELDSILNPPPG